MSLQGSPKALSNLSQRNSSNRIKSHQLYSIPRGALSPSITLSEGPSAKASDMAAASVTFLVTIITNN